MAHLRMDIFYAEHFSSYYFGPEIKWSEDKGASWLKMGHPLVAWSAYVYNWSPFPKFLKILEYTNLAMLIPKIAIKSPPRAAFMLFSAVKVRQIHSQNSQYAAIAR